MRTTFGFGQSLPSCRRLIKSPRLKKAMLPLFLSLAVLLAATAVQGKSFRVNSTFDINDLSVGNGLCVAYILISPPFVLPFCTLRAAVEESNNLPGHDVVELPAGTYALDLPGAGEDLAASGDLDIRESLTILGDGPDRTIIDGKSLDRLVDIVASGVEVTLRNLSLTGGRVSGAFAQSGQVGGGALRNLGRLSLENVVLLDHEVVRGGGGGRGGILFNSGICRAVDTLFRGGLAEDGGAVYNAASGLLSLTGSTLSGNIAVRGGGLSNDGSMTITNSTVSGNGDSATIAGGGIGNRGTLRLEYVTVTANRAVHGGGLSADAAVWVRNSIVAANTGPDCYKQGNIISGGFNLDSDGSCLLDQESDKTASTPGLRPLADYGGPTPTHALSPASPARDSAAQVSGIAIDQRGIPRPWGERPDIGACEYNGFPILPMISPLLR